MPLTEQQELRYARHLILEEVGEEGQERLLKSRVLVVGAGGLGSPLLMYLAAAGVGTLGVVDDDAVDLTNLQRQIVHSTAAVGRPKVESAAETLAAINPEIAVERHKLRLDAGNAERLVARYDLVADGSDNFATRYVLNEACFRQRKPLVWSALFRFEGQLTTFAAWREGNAPCLRCLFREPPPDGLVPRCETAGILGAVAGVMGTLQATEVLKELLGIGKSMSGRLMLYDALSAETRLINLKRDPECPTCGQGKAAA
jgi:adenylyltransferase/sulfurtransferase